MTDPADRYSKVLRRVWRDGWFLGLGPLPAHPGVLWLYLLTSPRMEGAPGLLPIGVATIAEDLGWAPSATGRLLARLENDGRILRSSRPALVWLPGFVRHNKPESPSVAVAWRRALDALPECDLRERARAAISVSLAGPFRAAFDQPAGQAAPQPAGQPAGQPAPQPAPHQEQEQEQENKNTPPPPSRGSAGPPGVCDPGSSRSEMTIAMEAVWEAYRRHHPQAGAGTRAGDGGPAGAARKLLRRACGDHDAGALVVLMEYVHTSGEGGPRFLRGENADGRKYLGLDNLLRAEKLPARVEAALAWEARGRQDEAAPSNGGGGSREDRLRQIGARVAAEQRAARAAKEEGP